jgi:hypothetical protein
MGADLTPPGAALGRLGPLVAAALIVGAEAAATQTRGPEELTAAQRRVVDDGGQVFLTEQVAGSAWPRASVYQYVDATPEEATAVFTDYALHTAFIPNVKKSVVARVIDRATMEVDYALRLPIVRDEEYTVRDRVTVAPGDTSYIVAWTLVRATSVKATEGYARFARYWNQRLQRQGTLVEYRNLVTPGSRLAGIPLIRSRALQQVRATVHAIAAQVERERTTDPGLLARQLRSLRSAVAR